MSPSHELRWHWARLDDSHPTAPKPSARQWHAVLALRSAVFVVEQACAFQDPDDADLQAWQLWAEHPRLGCVACLRLVDPGVKYPEPSIGRVITALAVRRWGWGRELMARGLAGAQAHWPGRANRISAQARLQAFYESLGYRAVGRPYLEDDIPHQEMLWTPPTP